MLSLWFTDTVRYMKICTHVYPTYACKNSPSSYRNGNSLLLTITEMNGFCMRENYKIGLPYSLLHLISLI